MMKVRVILCIIGALLVHLAVICFGGILFLDDENSHASHQNIELLSEDVEKEKVEEEVKDKVEELKAESEAPPDPNQVLQSVDSPVASDDAPALDAASLSAIEQVLNGTGGGGAGDFGGGLSLASGGRIGGTGKAGADDPDAEEDISRWVTRNGHELMNLIK